MRYIFVATMLLLASCRTAEQINAEMQTLVGMHINDVVSRVGPPESSFPLERNGQIVGYVYQWSDDRVAHMPGVTYQQPVTSQTTGSIYSPSTGNSAIYQGTTTTYQTVQGPGYNVSLQCVRRLTTNADGIVTNFAWEGNNC